MGTVTKKQIGQLFHVNVINNFKSASNHWFTEALQIRYDEYKNVIGFNFILA